MTSNAGKNVFMALLGCLQLNECLCVDYVTRVFLTKPSKFLEN